MRVNLSTTIPNNQVFCKPKSNSINRINTNNANIYIPCISFGNTAQLPEAKPFIYGAECQAGSKSGGVAAVVTDLGKYGYEFTPYYGARFFNEFFKKEFLFVKPTEIAPGVFRQEQKYKFLRSEVLTRVNAEGKEVPVFIHPDKLAAAKDVIQNVPEKDVQWLEEVASKEIETASGKEKAVIYRVTNPGHENRFYIFTQGTAAMEKPYMNNFGYSSNASKLGSANPYSVNCKAFVEMLPDLAQKGYISQGILFNDPQTAYACELLARKILRGDTFYQGLKAGYVCHNPGAGYQEKADLRSMFLNFASKEEIDAIDASKIYGKIKDREYLRNKFFSHFMPELVDSNFETSGLMLALRHREHGLLNYVGAVSPGAAESYCIGRGEADGVKKVMADLFNKGLFQGILNGLNDVNIDPTKDVSLKYNPKTGEVLLDKKTGKPQMSKEYYNADFINANNAKFDEETQAILRAEQQKAQGQNVEIPKRTVEKLEFEAFKTFDPDKQSLKEVIEAKQHNAASLFRRINASDGHYEYVTGAKSSKAKIIGKIDKRLIEAIENKDPSTKELVDLFVSWGRPDEQKGIDNAILSFKRYLNEAAEAAGGDINKSSAKNSVLIMGGAVGSSHLKDPIRKLIAEVLEDPLMKGRFVFLDGFAPNTVLGSASTFGTLPSRWAPCELVDHEIRKLLGIPIVGGIEGMADKNPDIRNPQEHDIATGFKTTHNNLTTVEEIVEEYEKQENAIKKAFEEPDKLIAKSKQEISDAQMIINTTKGNDEASQKAIKAALEKKTAAEKAIKEVELQKANIRKNLTTISSRTMELMEDYKAELKEFMDTQKKNYSKIKIDANGVGYAVLSEETLNDQIIIQLIKENNKKAESAIWRKRQAVIDSATQDDLIKIYKATSQLTQNEREFLMMNNHKMKIRWEDNSSLQRIFKDGKWEPANMSAKELYFKLCFDGEKVNPKKSLIEFTVEKLHEAEEEIRALLKKAEESIQDAQQAPINTNITPGNGRRFNPKKGITFAEKYLTKQTAVIAGGALAIAGLAYYLFKPEKQNNKNDDNTQPKHASTYIA
ncbi:MAG: hypothetical protein MJ180_03865 [Candidatus Gastranaerophilales bacterium]|nr:hypothetical protein [Candidatus Gastranaerophilales bacterium]